MAFHKILQHPVAARIHAPKEVLGVSVAALRKRLDNAFGIQKITAVISRQTLPVRCGMQRHGQRDEHSTNDRAHGVASL